MDSMLVVPSEILSTASMIEGTVANASAYLESNDSALCALTDFRREYPITVEAHSLIDEALSDMKRLKVHALLVTRQSGAANEQQVVGLITYYDIERRRPHRYPQATVASRRPGIRVGDVMTPCNELPLVKYESLQSLTAHDLHQLFQGTGLTHLLVIEDRGDESTFARGLISRAALTIRLHRARGASAH